MVTTQNKVICKTDTEESGQLPYFDFKEDIMKKQLRNGVVLLCTLALMTGCGVQDTSQETVQETMQSAVSETETVIESKTFEGTRIHLSEEGITVDEQPIAFAEPDGNGEIISDEAVYAANDIVFYLAGQGFTYGEGEAEEEHTQEEADAHTVVHITKPGTYVLSGELPKGQIAIDLGEDAESDPEAVVTLILNGVDISCEVAPAVMFYNVYECGSTDEEAASKDVDTQAAGANVLIADGTVNNVTGSHVARIYKSVELNEAGTEVVKSKKLHKYDGAFYSKMSMNVNGDEEGTGILNIYADNEGLDTELHLTINGGNINIWSGNDGINTNEDGISVTTINGGTLTIEVTGETGEGDGIDSNGWIVINGGTVISSACGQSMDAGIDSDMGIYIYGGTVAATGNMYDHIAEDSTQNFAVFSFASRQSGTETYTLKDEAGEAVAVYAPANDFTYLVLSGADLTAGSYTLWQGDTQLSASQGTDSMMGGFGGGMPEGGERPEGVPEMPEGGERPEGMPEMPEGGERPEGIPEMPEGMEKPEGEVRPDKGGFGQGMMEDVTLSSEIVISDGANFYHFVSAAE